MKKVLISLSVTVSLIYNGNRSTEKAVAISPFFYLPARVVVQRQRKWLCKNQAYIDTVMIPPPVPFQADLYRGLHDKSAR